MPTKTTKAKGAKGADRLSTAGTQYTTVDEGESLDDVAAALGVDADALYIANRDVIGSNPASVAPGMVLAVPSNIASIDTAAAADEAAEQAEPPPGGSASPTGAPDEPPA